MNWRASFEEPIVVGRKTIATLEAAAGHVLTIGEPDDLWEKAGACLLRAAEADGHPVMVQIARIAFMKALLRDAPAREPRVTWRDRRKARRP